MELKPKSHYPGNLSTKVVEKQNRFVMEKALKQNGMHTPGRNRRNPTTLHSQAEHSVPHTTPR